MSKLGIVLFLLCQVTAVLADDIVGDYPLKQVDCHTYVIYGAIGRPSPQNQGFVGNTGFVVSQNGVVVIDPGSSLQAGRMVLRRIRDVTHRPVTHVINTHAHGEHWLGNQAIVEAFPEVRILAHHRMLKEMDWMVANDWIEYMEKMTEGFTRGTRVVPPRESVRGVMSLYLGDVTLHVRALNQGEEETSVVVEVVEDSLAFIGEELKIERQDPDSEMTDLPDPVLCQITVPVEVDYYVPDHGPVGPVGLVECPDASVIGDSWTL